MPVKNLRKQYNSSANFSYFIQHPANSGMLFLLRVQGEKEVKKKTFFSYGLCTNATSSPFLTMHSQLISFTPFLFTLLASLFLF